MTKAGYVDGFVLSIQKKNTAKYKKMANTKPGEAVWFSFITYKSRKHRDEVNKKVMAYFNKKYGKNEMPMPFDMKRFAYGGFKVVVSG